MNHLMCPNCYKILNPKDVDIISQKGHCSQCNTDFALNEATVLYEPKPNVEFPGGMEVVESKEELRIKMKWRDISYGLKFYSTFSFLILGISTLLLLFTWGMDISELTKLVLWNIFGLILSYIALVYMTNETNILVNKDYIDINHGPLFYIKLDEKIRVKDIDQLYVECKRYQSSRGEARAINFKVKKKNGRSFDLLKGLGSVEHYQYLEQEIERYLGIEDKQVRDELKTTIK